MVIAAQDNGPQPRVTTATATVVVLDFPDERPKFSQQKYEADVPENIIDFFVAQVQVRNIAPPSSFIFSGYKCLNVLQATDMDSESSVTYTIRQGDNDKFRIDPQSGIVRTRRSLDYERQAQYVLVIGTLENTEINDPQATTTLFVNVQVFKYLFFRMKSQTVDLKVNFSLVLFRIRTMWLPSTAPCRDQYVSEALCQLVKLSLLL